MLTLSCSGFCVHNTLFSNGLILTKFTNLDGALSKMNEGVKKLESNNKKTAPNSKNKNG
jgi:hypothetical protein